jgi:hypothetical protein
VHALRSIANARVLRGNHGDFSSSTSREEKARKKVRDQIEGANKGANAAFGPEKFWANAGGKSPICPREEDALADPSRSAYFGESLENRQTQSV